MKKILTILIAVMALSGVAQAKDIATSGKVSVMSRFLDDGYVATRGAILRTIGSAKYDNAAVTVDVINSMNGEGVKQFNVILDYALLKNLSVGVKNRSARDFGKENDWDVHFTANSRGFKVKGQRRLSALKEDSHFIQASYMYDTICDSPVSLEAVVAAGNHAYVKEFDSDVMSVVVTQCNAYYKVSDKVSLVAQALYNPQTHKNEDFELKHINLAGGVSVKF